MPAIATRTIQMLCLLAPVLAWAQEQPRVYYVDGELFQQLTDRGVTVILGIKDDGKSNWLTVSVDNDSNGGVTILPSAVTLHEKSPKDQELRMKSEKDLGKSVGHQVFWGQVVASVGIALSRNISTRTTTDSYGNSFRTVENTPDYEAQARWLAWADARAAEGQALREVIHREYLRANTIFQGSRFAARLCFARDKAFANGAATVSLGDRVYVFPLPPSASAPAPSSAPQLPKIGSVSIASSSLAPVSVSDTQAQTPARTRSAGVLGISGANWSEAGYSGVEITDIAPDSAAETAGLHAGYVITEVNGNHVHSTDDLANVLGHSGPGARITIGYIVKTNLGWMPGSTNTVLTEK